MRINCTALMANPNPAIMANTPMNRMESRLRGANHGQMRSGLDDECTATD